MAYSVDRAYVNYFKCAADGKYDNSFFRDRLKVTAFAAGTTLAGSFRTVGRVINLIIGIAKVSFYVIASLFTLGRYGNIERLRNQCKLFVLNTGALIAQPLQLVVHALAIVVGIASPKVAYRMMQGASTPLSYITSQEKKIWQDYRAPQVYTNISNSIKTKILNIVRNSSIEMAMKTLTTEFPAAFDFGLVTPLGFMDRFHLFEANPQILTDKQKGLTPILLINGNFSHQATFLPLLHALKESGNKRPVYTFNLPPNTLDVRLIESKVANIMAQYNKNNDSEFKVDMIGHSMGSILIQDYCANNNSKPKYIGRVITVGAPVYIQRLQQVAKIFDVVAKNDLLIGWNSFLGQENKKEIDTGHLGLLSHPESLKAIQDFLKL